MIEKVVVRRSLKDSDSSKEDLEYWLSRTPEERVEAVELLRRAVYGDTGRIQKVVRVIKRSEDK